MDAVTKCSAGFSFRLPAGDCAAPFCPPASPRCFSQSQLDFCSTSSICHLQKIYTAIFPPCREKNPNEITMMASHLLINLKCVCNVRQFMRKYVSDIWKVSDTYFRNLKLKMVPQEIRIGITIRNFSQVIIMFPAFSARCSISYINLSWLYDSVSGFTCNRTTSSSIVYSSARC